MAIFISFAMCDYAVVKIAKIPTSPSHKALVINWLLICLIVVVNGYILWGLFGPKLELTVQTAISDPPKVEVAPEKIPKENRLIIPSIYLDEKITEGPTEAALLKGAWRRPGTSSPEIGGNTVLAGHRFTYQGKSIFYNLDKVKVGDEIAVAWSGEMKHYIVSETKNVLPSDTTIEAPSSEEKLTLYTCTPLWTTKERLVIIALPSGEKS